jgi:AraC family transcriptional regulator
MPTEREILQLLRRLSDAPEAGLSLEAMAATAGWSRFHFHRAFRRVVGETPKQYTLRLRLERAAARLAGSDVPVHRIAAEAGFASHEVFTRAFRRQFATTPAAWRVRRRVDAGHRVRALHSELLAETGPCVGLYHINVNRGVRRSPMSMLSIERRELAPAHVLIVRARCGRHEIAAKIGECLGQAFPYAQRAGAAIAGRPFTRYRSTGPGLFSIEAGMVIASPVAGEGAVEYTTLPGGPAVVAIHGGPYDQLGETYSEMERWSEANGLHVGDAPWESYITDPAEFPDAAQWRTEIYWPLRT